MLQRSTPPSHTQAGCERSHPGNWPGTNSFFLAVDEDGMLRLYGTLRGDVALTPTSGEVALVAGLGRNRGESVRAVTVDGREQIELWGYRYRSTP